MKSAKLLRITTVPISLKLLLTGQARFMLNSGVEVLLCSAEGKEIEAVKEQEGCPHIVIPFTRQITPIQDLKCLWFLIKIIQTFKPDIVHTHTPKAGLIGMLAAKICGVPLKMHTIAGLPLMTTSGAKRKLLGFIEKVTYWGADYVLPNSRSIMSFVKEHGYTTNSKLAMIGGGSSNGIDLKRFSKSSIIEDKLDRIKENINYDFRCKYILAIGRVVKDKGIVELVNAFIQLHHRYNELKLILIGPLENERIEELLPVEILECIKNNASIIHIQWSDEVEYYMALVDVLVHASYREGFPNVLLQAGAMECPIICSDIMGNIDLISNEETGLYFKVGSIEDLKLKLEYTLTNPLEMSEFAKILRLQVVRNFSRTYIHQELLNFYKTKLNERCK